MTTIRINLLPHRQLKRERQAKQFNILAGGVVALAVAAVLAAHMLITGAQDQQTQRNEFLRQEISQLEQKLKEIKTLKEKTQALLARKQAVESLQANRAVPVHIMDELARRLPEGVHLRTFKLTDKTLSIQGYAQSSALVSSYMRNLEDSDWFENPVLIEVRAATVNNVRSNDFSLTLTISDPNAKPGKGAP
ncbi:MAG: PilN domain-containing protein [Hydrogenophilaceae bacterium]|nr:PilN domain-containing protein [Hydrogenophilaceae bacterium]